jgi:hypothetical protein
LPHKQKITGSNPVSATKGYIMDTFADIVDEATMRECTKCHETLPLSEFYIDRKNKDELRRQCKECACSYNRKRRKDNPEKIRREQRGYSRKWREAKPEHNMWRSAKFRAKQKKLEFTIVPEDIIIPSFCPLLNIPLYITPYAHTNKGRNTANSPSLDRLDSTLGYIKENIWVISTRANTLKNNASLEEHQKLVHNWKKKINVL